MTTSADNAARRAPKPQEKLAFKTQEAANSLGLSQRTIMEMVANNEIPYVRLGKRNLRFPVDALREWVAKRTTWPIELRIAEIEAEHTTTHQAKDGSQ